MAGQSLAQKNEQLERHARIMELSTAGVPTLMIANEMGLSLRRTQEIIHEELTAVVSERRTILRNQQLRRIHALFRAAYPRALAGSQLHIGRCTELLKREAELEGLDEPQRIRKEWITEEDIRAAIEENLAKAARLREEREASQARRAIRDGSIDAEAENVT